MSISNSDVHWLKAATGASDGGACSATEIAATPNDLWPDFTDAERQSGATHYKKWFVKNESGLDSLMAPSIYVDTPPLHCNEFLGVGFDDSSDADPGMGELGLFTGSQATLVSDGADTRSVVLVGLGLTGAPQEETVILNGTTPVLSASYWLPLYAAHLDSPSSSRTVSVKEGSTLRGTIGTTKTNVFCWVVASSAGAGLLRKDLAAGSNYGVWDRIDVPANVDAARPTQSVVAYKEMV